MGNPLQIAVGAAEGKTGSLLQTSIDTFLPTRFPSFEQSWHAYTTGEMSYDDVKQVAQINGVLIDTNSVKAHGLPAATANTLADWWTRVTNAEVEYTGIDESIELWLRGYYSEGDRDKAMAHQGVWQQNQRDARLELYKVIPEPNRLIDMAAKGAWSPYLIQQWGLDSQYPSYMESYARPSGELWDIPDPIFAGTSAPNMTWFRAEWYAHWSLPGWSEVMEMVYRLRPGMNNVGFPRDPSGIVLSDKEFQDYQSVSNIPPYWRDRLRAISHPLPQHRHLSSLYDAGIVGESDVKEYLRDEGYWPRDVDVLATEIVLKEEIAETKRINMEIAKVSIDCFTLGIMDEDELRINLYRSTLKTVNQTKNFDASPYAAQSAAAQSDPYASAQIASLQLKLIMEQAKGTIEGIKKQFLGGEIDEPKAKSLLAQVGVNNVAIGTYLDAWKIEFHPKHKELETKELLDSAKYGFLAIPTLIARLVNLGWDLPDIGLMLANLNREVGIELQKQQVEQAKSVAEQQRQVQELAKQAAEQQRKAHETLLTHGNPSDLARWLTNGIITAAQFTQRMLALGVPQDAIDNELRYMTIQQAAKAAKAVPKLPKPKPPKTAYPSEADLKRWLSKGVITQQQFDDGLKTLGYDQQAISDFDQSP